MFYPNCGVVDKKSPLVLICRL